MQITDDYMKQMTTKNKEYVIQKFIPHNTLNNDYEKLKPYSEEEMEKMEEVCHAKVL